MIKAPIDMPMGVAVPRLLLANLPVGTTRPLYRPNGQPLEHGDAWVDITDPDQPVVRIFYAPASFDESFDSSFQI